MTDDFIVRDQIAKLGWITVMPRKVWTGLYVRSSSSRVRSPSRKSILWSQKTERKKSSGLYVRCGKLLWKIEFSTGLRVRLDDRLPGLYVRFIGTLRAYLIYPVAPVENPVVEFRYLWILWEIRNRSTGGGKKLREH